jgi:hypothetical protein
MRCILNRRTHNYDQMSRTSVYDRISLDCNAAAHQAILSQVEIQSVQGIDAMNLAAFQASLQQDEPPASLSAPIQALWWDAKGDWTQAHQLVDELETPDGMAVHAYLHRKEGEQWNADYWYRLAGRTYHRNKLSDEWTALVEGLLRQQSNQSREQAKR